MAKRNVAATGLLQEYSDIVYIPFRPVIIATGIIMSGGFMLCVLLALIYHFERSTWTHCQVPNYLPSISAAISIPPSVYVWRFIVAITTTHRLSVFAFHYNHYSGVSVPSRQYRRLCKLCFGCEFMENTCLIGLSCVSSTENHDWHANFFIGFQLFAMIFMLLMCIVYQQATQYEESNYLDEQFKNTQQLKWAACGTNYGAFFISMYFYYRHNTYCEPGVYTIFALLEYLIVLSNIAFHMIVSLDFSDREIRFGVKRTDKIS